MLSNWITKQTTRAWRHYADDPAKGLLHLGAIGWVLSSAAQTFMIATNKDIDSHKKKFLIPQELTDGAVNLTLYYTITAGIKKFADSLVENGHIIGEETDKFFTDFTKNIVTTTNHYVKSLSEKFDKAKITEKINRKKHMSGALQGIEKTLNELDHNKIKVKGYHGLLEDSFDCFETKEIANKTLASIKSANKEFGKLKNATNVIATIVGSVIASSIIVPIVRNKVANIQQKRMSDKEQIRKPQLHYTQIYKTPKSSVFNKLAI